MADLPHDYIVQKFYELGYYAQYNQSPNNYSCSCPICKEGNTGIGKAKRCYYLPESKRIYCHRCGSSLTPIQWIKEVSGMSYRQIWREVHELDYAYIDVNKLSVRKSEFTVNFDEVIEDLPTGTIDLSNPITRNFYKDNEIIQKIVSYLEERRLFTAVNTPSHWYTTLTDFFHANRLVIPFYDSDNTVKFYQSRDVMGGDNIRYISKKFGVRSIFNMNNIDPELGSYFIFEGPFDSCFVKNGVAVGGINLGSTTFTEVQKVQLRELSGLNRIWVLDSPYLDETARKKALELMALDEMVFVWPQKYGRRYKDINEWCVDEGIDEIRMQFIEMHARSGEEGVKELMQLLNEENPKE